jgi:hypothetical protein
MLRYAASSASAQGAQDAQHLSLQRLDCVQDPVPRLGAGPVALI